IGLPSRDRRWQPCAPSTASLRCWPRPSVSVLDLFVLSFCVQSRSNQVLDLTGFAAMTEPALVARQRTVLHDLAQLVGERARVEPTIEAEARTRATAAEQEYEASFQAIIARFALEKETADREYQEAKLRIAERFGLEQAAANKEFSETRTRGSARYLHDKTTAKTTFQEARWTMGAVFGGNRNDAEKELREVQGRIAAGMQRILTIGQEADALLREWNYQPEEAGTSLPEWLHDESKAPLRNLQQCIKRADAQLEDLKSLTVPRWAKGKRL